VTGAVVGWVTGAVVGAGVVAVPQAARIIETTINVVTTTNNFFMVNFLLIFFNLFLSQSNTRFAMEDFLVPPPFSFQSMCCPQRGRL
jgi:uncharacterized membrane protein YfcA